MPTFTFLYVSKQVQLFMHNIWLQYDFLGNNHNILKLILLVVLFNKFLK